MADTLAQLLQYLKTPSTRQQALDLLLSLTASEEESAQVLLGNKDIQSTISRFLSEEESKETSLTAVQILINMSSSDQHLAALSQVGLISRCFNFLRTLIKPGAISSSAPSEKMALADDGQYLVKPESLEIVGALFMLLTNLTREEKGQRAFLRLESDKLKGIYLTYTLGWFLFFSQAESFLFCGNLLVNITSLKEGRNYFFEIKDWPANLRKILQSLTIVDGNNPHRLLQTIQILRNLCFEYETHIKKLLRPGLKLVESVQIYLIQLIENSLSKQGEHIASDLKENENEFGYQLRKRFGKPGYEGLEDPAKAQAGQLGAEVLLLLTNSQAGRLVMKNEGVHLVSAWIVQDGRWWKAGLSEEGKDKLEAVRLQLIE